MVDANNCGYDYIGYLVVEMEGGHFEFAILRLSDGFILYQSKGFYDTPEKAQAAFLEFMVDLELKNPGILAEGLASLAKQVPTRSVEYFH